MVLELFGANAEWHYCAIGVILEWSDKGIGVVLELYYSGIGMVLQWYWKGWEWYHPNKFKTPQTKCNNTAAWRGSSGRPILAA